MSHQRLDISDAQTLRLLELRKIMDESLPASIVEAIQYPTANYSCLQFCGGTCVGGCTGNCNTGCKGGCQVGCLGICAPGCGLACGGGGYY